MTKPKANPHGFPTGRGWTQQAFAAEYRSTDNVLITLTAGARRRYLFCNDWFDSLAKHRRDLAALKDAIAWVEKKT